jgi:hypothetical protein
VEGPSDELVVTRAYHDEHGREHIADGVDILEPQVLAANGLDRMIEILGKS